MLPEADVFFDDDGKGNNEVDIEAKDSFPQKLQFWKISNRLIEYHEVDE